VNKNLIKLQLFGQIFNKASAVAESYFFNQSPRDQIFLIETFQTAKGLIVSDIIKNLQPISVAPNGGFKFNPRVATATRELAPVTGWYTASAQMFRASMLAGNQNDLTKTLGEVGGFKNSAEIKQKNNINSIIGVEDPAGFINKGEIEQKGMLNLQLGIGRKFGIFNSGQIKSTGTSIVGGFGLAFGVFNTGSVKLSGENSRIIGGGVLNGIWNLGELQTSNKSDIVAGISGGIGIANGFDLNPALYPDILPKTLKVLQAAASASEINTKEGDDLISGGGLYNVIDFLSKLPGTTEFVSIASKFLGDITSTNPNSKDASIGILNFGKINTGLGNDVVFGAGDDITAPENMAVLSPAGIGSIFGNINAGVGNDVVFGAGDDITAPENMAVLSAAGIGSIGSGIINAKTGIINLGEGDDLLVGETWAVGPLNGGVGPRAGIVNYGLINTGDGNDHICGFSGTTAQDNKGIFNDGTIITGNGNDFIDALTGGFSGAGLTDLGLGDDTLVGFGSGRFDGGSGIKDKVLLADGSYAFAGFGRLGNEPDAAGYFKLTTGSDTMLIKNFELIGSAAAAADPNNAIQFNLGGVYSVVGTSISFVPLLF
jgi:hypothetical protein